VAKFGAIPHLFSGGLNSTFNYRVISHKNSIKLKNAQLIQKNLKLGGYFPEGI
jgi:hypothetical protein